ncbi:cytochrome d ubiquinol oxidase subunit II [Trabulsiella odontotermitis]|uniref:Cytochrome D oxidase subunit II n=1 Tax=Trabulsiella odontotermitis TaxID=379893 RepID=A0A0L0GPY9_9ENTR|nr:cytochrome d ubiquinol oxidase subunit II [Trabulsiella odontotermitis]KNC91032.1 cytochrome D oxidase subunit II [Trabulsiella odontotermitis]
MTEFFGLPLLNALSAAALAFSLWIYVLLDGTDLGVGILCGLQRSDEDRHRINISLLPVWDGNETWLVLAAGGMLGLFPLAYAIVLSALYVPVFAMLLALIGRGMAIEYRHHAPRLFDAMLIAGSIIASLAQGMMAGSLIQGIPNNGQQFTGTGWEWLSPFPLFCGITLVAGYCLMGAGWLNWRCTGALATRARRAIPWLAALTVLLLAGLLFWTVNVHETWRRHLMAPLLWLPLAGVTVAGCAGLWFALSRGYAFLPMAAIQVIVSGAFGALVFTLFPLIVPVNVLIHHAAAPPETQKFLLISFALLVPVTLVYNTWVFRVFSGKIH